jgi:iron complex outermembrane receptor protein
MMCRMVRVRRSLFGARYSLDVNLLDIDRIEVLRGPQGTLYGSVPWGGLIKYVSKQPDAGRFGVDVQTGIAATREGGISYNGALAVNAPLVTDKLAVRASVYYSRDGRYIDNVALNQKDANRAGIYGGRLDVLFKPSDALTIRVGAFQQNIERDGQVTADYSDTGVPEYGILAQNRLYNEPFAQPIPAAQQHGYL